MVLDIAYLTENTNISFYNCQYQQNQASNLIFHCFNNGYFDAFNQTFYDNLASIFNEIYLIHFIHS